MLEGSQASSKEPSVRMRDADMCFQAQDLHPAFGYGAQVRLQILPVLLVFNSPQEVGNLLLVLLF